VNVAQDVEEDWPLEVYDRSGNAVNITMEPGDMVFYESHSLIHGRPFALNGRYYANIFIHFEPYEAEGAEVPDGELPPYVLPDSPVAKDWDDWNPEADERADADSDPLPTSNEYASLGSLDELKEMAAQDTTLLHTVDQNGWQPVSEVFCVNLVDWCAVVSATSRKTPHLTSILIAKLSSR
jgi:prolyl 4-hydroxylase